MWAIVLDAVYETNGTFVIFINSTLASLLPIVNGGVRLPAGYHDNNILRRTGNSKFALPLLVFFCVPYGIKSNLVSGEEGDDEDDEEFGMLNRSPKRQGAGP